MSALIGGGVSVSRLYTSHPLHAGGSVSLQCPSVQSVQAVCCPLHTGSCHYTGGVTFLWLVGFFTFQKQELTLFAESPVGLKVAAVLV